MIEKRGFPTLFGGIESEKKESTFGGRRVDIEERDQGTTIEYPIGVEGSGGGIDLTLPMSCENLVGTEALVIAADADACLDIMTTAVCSR